MPDANMPVQHWLSSLAGRVALPGPVEDLELTAADGGAQMAVTAVHRVAFISLGERVQTVRGADSARCRQWVPDGERSIVCYCTADSTNSSTEQ